MDVIKEQANFMKKIILSLMIGVLIVGCSGRGNVSWEECCSILKSTLNQLTSFREELDGFSYTDANFAERSGELNEIIAQIKREVDLDLVSKEVLRAISNLESSSERITKLSEISDQIGFAVELDNIRMNFEEAENTFIERGQSEY